MLAQSTLTCIAMLCVNVLRAKRWSLQMLSAGMRWDRGCGMRKWGIPKLLFQRIAVTASAKENSMCGHTSPVSIDLVRGSCTSYRPSERTRTV
jgi:hypothetical protein